MTGRRKSYRLKNHDYSSEGYYFLTLLTKNRIPYFGKISGAQVQLSEHGKIAHTCLLSLGESFPLIRLDEYIIMPDHIHMIIQIDDCFTNESHAINPTHNSPWAFSKGARKGLINQALTGCTGKSWILMLRPEMHLGKIVRYYKAKVSRLMHKTGLIDFQWVSRYHDHFIRSEKSLYYIRRYIQENPVRHQDKKAA